MSRAIAMLALLSWVVTPPVAHAATPATSPAATSAPAPSFSGHWALDLPASDLGKGRKPPRARADNVVLAGVWADVHSMTVRAGGDTLRLDYRYRTDGDAVNKLMGQEMHTHGSGEGTALRFESVAQVLMMRLAVIELWSLSGDGGTFTIERNSDSPLGKEHQRLVFRRRVEP